MNSKTKHKAQWENEDAKKLLLYNCLDTCATARVDREIRKEPDWNTPRVQRLFQMHEELSKLGSEMHMRGITVHQENRRKLIKQLKMLSTRRHNELIAHVGPRRSPAFRGKPDDMRALLYKRHSMPGIRCYEVPEPEEWDKEMWTDDTCTTLSVDKGSLLRIFINPITSEDCRDAIQLYWRAKAPGKALSTWVDGKEINERICDDGRARHEWNSAGTETMRWAGEAMTLPQDKDDDSLTGKLPNIREMYCATDGMNLFHWDFAQQELRVWASVYKCRALQEALDTGDVYSYDARKWFKDQLIKHFGAEWQTINLKKKWKNGRRQCKVIHLGAQYMAGSPAIWTQGLVQDRTLKFSAVKVLTGMFHDTYAEGIENIKKEHESVDKLGYSEGALLQGRRYYPAPPPITETANYPVQRTAGEMGAIAKLAIRAEIKKQKLPVYQLTDEHDAVTYEYEHRDSIERELKDIVTTYATGPWVIRGTATRMPVDFSTGHTWAECTSD